MTNLFTSSVWYLYSIAEFRWAGKTSDYYIVPVISNSNAAAGSKTINNYTYIYPSIELNNCIRIEEEEEGNTKEAKYKEDADNNTDG